MGQFSGTCISLTTGPISFKFGAAVISKTLLYCLCLVLYNSANSLVQIFYQVNLDTSATNGNMICLHGAAIIFKEHIAIRAKSVCELREFPPHLS